MAMTDDPLYRREILRLAADATGAGHLPQPDAVASLRAGLRQATGRWQFSQFLRIDNLGDKKYSGSVIVNEGNSRFFEPAPERNYLVGISASYGF